MSDMIKNRYEFSLFFEVENGNPNGDPDAGNMPRRDSETGFGIITDVCLKRKIRNYVDVVKQDAVGYKIYVRNGVPLDTNRKWAYEECNVKVPMKNGKVTADEPDDKEDYKKLTRFMCQNFFDIRSFGAVMTLAYNCGQVRGPVQLGFAKSIDMIAPQEIGITSCTYANEGEKSSKMGRKNILPYALYRVDGFISPSLALKETGGTGFSYDDLNLLWEALINMFDFDHSAARGKMASRALFIFKHDSVYGNCPAYKLFEAIIATKKEGVISPRSFNDYVISVNEDEISENVTLERLL